MKSFPTINKISMRSMCVNQFSGFISGGEVCGTRVTVEDGLGGVEYKHGEFASVEAYRAVTRDLGKKLSFIGKELDFAWVCVRETTGGQLNNSQLFAFRNQMLKVRDILCEASILDDQSINALLPVSNDLITLSKKNVELKKLLVDLQHQGTNFE